MARTSKDTKRHDIQVLGGMPLLINAPYVTQKQWAAQTGMTVEAIKQKLNKGGIARYQPIEGGIVYVNVLAEMKKVIEAPDY